MQRSFTSANNLPAILAVMREAAAFVKEQGVSPRSLYITNLVLEEVLTNIVKYSFDDEGLHEIKVEALVDKGQISLEFHDDGHEFDPLQAPPPKFGEPVKTQRLGGRGIYLVKNFAEKFHFRREEGWNILTVEFPAQAGKNGA